MHNNALPRHRMSARVAACMIVLFVCALATAFSDDAMARPANRKAAATPIPQLRVEHGTTQLIVDGKRFLILGGELDNSSASSRAFMRPIWPMLAAMHMNTVLAPAYWELIEPVEGHFDFSSVDGLLTDARKHKMHVVLLWFGSWKNSMSSYVPAWVKRDQTRFVRAMKSDGTGLEILSPLGVANLAADSRAFVALMKHLREKDQQHTVLMVQPENEIGMIPEARDHSPAAEVAFKASVPAQLTDYLASHKNSLVPSLRDAWAAHGFKVGAGWEDTFGAGPATDEMFNAWTQALYAGKVAAAGKAVYPLPIFVNAALIRAGRTPGQYPSGGPLPHVFDIWRAAAPAIDMLSPDLYFPSFVEWALRYSRPDNPFFIPETGRVDAAEMGANALWAFGQLNAIGFSPYAPEFLKPEDQKTMALVYDVLHQIAPQILATQGAGRIAGFRPPTTYEGVTDLAPQKVTFGNYTVEARFKAAPPPSVGQREDIELPGAHGGLIIQTGPEEFLVAGTGMDVFFGTTGMADPIAGLDSVWEGEYVNGKWIPGRLLNGDETNQGRQVKVPSGKFTILRVKVYHYR